ncbi:MAG TPA: discoidin domain-containing protein [Armatimonadota bacterium]|nr:discoidin domain-containing protein [Armatimonadota bacterium]
MLDELLRGFSGGYVILRQLGRRRMGVAALALGLLLALASASRAQLPVDLASVIRDDWTRQAADTSERGPATAEDDAAGGCDGIKDGGTGFHTEKQQDPWWQVDLGSVMPLSRIVLWNRTDHEICLERARRVVLLLSTDGAAWEEIYRHAGPPFHGFSGGPPLTVPASGKNARFVRVGLANDEYFHLDEVEVFAAAERETNVALDRPATQSSTSDWSTPRKKPVVYDRDSRFFQRAAGQALDLAAATRALMPGNDRLASFDTGLASLREKFDLATPDADLQDLFFAARQLRRELILSHPDLDFDRLLINKRPPPKSLFAHLCDQYYGRHSRPGPGLTVLESWKDAPRETALFEGKLPEGSILHPDLSFDAKRVIFSFCDHAVAKTDDVRIPTHPNVAAQGYDNDVHGRKRFLIYEGTLDGSSVRQLTGTADDPMTTPDGRRTVLIEDFDPCYLPDGGFAFVSTRNQGFGRCHWGRYTPSYLLYRANGDGANIAQISFGEANEWDPAVLPDGRIIYTRWDYINRHNSWYQSLWTTNPDGRATEHYYGNYSQNPCMLAEARPVPGTDRILATSTAHHFISAGSIVRVDPRLGLDGPEPLTRLTPEIAFPETEGWDLPGCYTNPFPITEDLFLAAYSAETVRWESANGQCSGTWPSESAFGIYLVDSLGGRELIYRDPETSCFAPIPVRPRTRPPVLPAGLADDGSGRKTGICVLSNVYDASYPLEPGSIHRLRLNRIHSQPAASAAGRSPATEEVVKSVIGTVPVAPDGSAAFEVPADVGFQIQALDENGLAVMTMRSLMYVRPGETIGCGGCHEPSASAPSSTQHAVPATAVSTPEPLPGPRYEGGFSFMRSVQPVLDRHCIRCHGLDEEVAGDLNLLGDRAHASLTQRPGLVAVAASNSEAAISTPKDHFAHAGRLAGILLEGTKGHEQVAIPRDDLERIIAWLDLNGQQFGDYSFNRREDRAADPEGEKRLRAAVSEKFGEAFARRPFAALVNVGQPDASPILRAPLAIAGGGWGQVPDAGWDSEQHPEFQRFQTLVDNAIAPLPYRDRQGTCGRQPCICGSCWVRELALWGKDPSRSALRP